MVFRSSSGWGNGDNLPRSRYSLELDCRSQSHRPKCRAESRCAIAFSARSARSRATSIIPNVARVTYYGEQDGECFYVMELVKGETLEASVRREGPMPLALALEVIEQAARALAAAETVRRGASRHQAVQHHARIGSERRAHCKADRLWSGESNGASSRARHRANTSRLHWHPRFCKPGAVRSVPGNCPLIRVPTSTH